MWSCEATIWLLFIREAQIYIHKGIAGNSEQVVFQKTSLLLLFLLVLVHTCKHLIDRVWKPIHQVS